MSVCQKAAALQQSQGAHLALGSRIDFLHLIAQLVIRAHIGLEIIQILAHRFTIVPDITHRRGTLSAETFLSVIVLSFGVMQPLITAFSHTDDIAQAGLQYGKDQYDRERYAELRQIAAEMLSARTGLPTEKIHDLFCNETGYQTPKVDTRAAVFADGRILLVHENNGTWALPGGWCDVDQSIASNTEKEVREEAGFEVTAERLIAVQAWQTVNGAAAKQPRFLLRMRCFTQT